jgi:hypothetical protein
MIITNKPKSLVSNVDLNAEDMRLLLTKQKEAWLANGIPDYARRIDRMDRLIALLVDNRDDIAATVSDYSGYTPLCVYEWPHETTPEALVKNRKGVANFIEMLTRANRGAQAYAERVGLKIDWGDPYATISKLAWLTQTPKEFDFESSHWPPQFYHTRPFHDGAGRIDTDFPWERLTGERLVYASMGTVQNGLADVFRAIVAAASKHKDVQLVLSIGNNLDPKQIGPLSSNTILVKSAPQLEILEQASVCITHAGLKKFAGQQLAALVRDADIDLFGAKSDYLLARR